MGDEVYLFGAPDLSVGDSLSVADRFRLEKFTSSQTGIVTQIRFYRWSYGYIKFAMYADSGGTPSTLLGQCDPYLAATSGINTTSLQSPIPIGAGNAYWIAYNSSNTVMRMKYTSSGGPMWTKDAEYDDFSFPNPAGSGFSEIKYTMMAACWGTLATGGTGRMIGSGDPGMIHVAHPKMIHVANPSLIRARGG
jgi:hypothetical protein